ncbi:MAG: hypothetical protein UCH28_06450, partial [Adlercreutzia sp.]|nr:hypothetical protein [Adlercreutzia sp.]
MEHNTQNNRGNATNKGGLAGAFAKGRSDRQRENAYDSQAHWHTEVPAAPAPINSFAAKTWTKVLSVCLSLLLALTMFDATALTSYADELADNATPMADTADQEEAAKAAEEEARRKAAEDEKRAWATTAQGAALDQEVVEGLLPSGLVAADQVLPQIAVDADEAAKSKLADRLAPALVVSGVPYSASQGLFVKGTKANAAFELGNLDQLLAGGYLAGSREGDRFVLTLEAPYLYLDDDGAVATTASEEEWKLRTALADQAERAIAQADGAATSLEQAQSAAAQAAADAATTKGAMRAAVFADAVPAGWSLWQEHDGKYLQVTDDMLKAGVSGRLVLRYDANDGKLDAAAALPALQLGLVGGVPEGTPVSVYYGYEAHSFTAADKDAKPQYGNVKRGNAGAYNLVNDTSEVKADLSVKPVAALMPRTPNSTATGYAAYVARFAIPKDAPNATALALGVQFPVNAAEQQGLTLANLMAYTVDKDGNPQENMKNGAVNTAKKVREDNTFVGVPGKGGVLVLDVTDLTDEQIAAINPLKASSLEALGLEPLAYTVTEDARIQLSRTGKNGRIEAEGARQLYVAAPFAESAVVFAQNADSSEPLKAHFDVQVAATEAGESVVAADTVTLETRFAAAEMGDDFLTDEQVEAQEKADQPETSEPSDGEEPAPTLPGLPTIGGDGNEPTAENPGAESTEPTGPVAEEPTDAAEEPEAPRVVGGPVEEPASDENVAPAANYTERPELAPVALFGALDGASYLATQALDLNITPFASQQYQLPTTYLDPNLHIAGGTPVDGQTNTQMIKTSEIVTVTLQPNPTYKSGFLGKSEAFTADQVRNAAVLFTLEIPYLYFTDTQVKETVNELEWRNAQAQWTADKKPMYKNEEQRLALFPDSNAINVYEFSNDGGNTWLTSTDMRNKYAITGMTGTWTLRYRSTNSAKPYQLPASGSQTGLFDVKFVGSVPDNTGATAKLGYTYNTYTDGTGVETRGATDTVVAPGTARSAGASNVLTATFIQTNLKWDLINERVVSKPVLWDQYNYAVYKVTVQNVSETRESEIDFMNYVFRFDSADGSTQGLRAIDTLTWKYDASTKLDKNNPNAYKINTAINAGESGAKYIGKPKNGGILIYDVSKLSKSQIAKINTDDFSNVDDFGLTPLPYGTGGQSGQITVDFAESEMPYGKHLISHDPKADENFQGTAEELAEAKANESDSLVLLIALPYTTNYSNASGNYPDASWRIWATSNFGNRGYDSDGQSLDYQWMKSTESSSNFTAPIWDASVSKVALNANGNESTTTVSMPMGEMVKYRIKDIKNTGNVPLYGDDVNDATYYGPVLSDQLPKGFHLSGIDIKVNRSDYSETTGPVGDGTGTVADIGDWFDLETGHDALGSTVTMPVQFQVKDSSGNTSWRFFNIPSTIDLSADGATATLHIGSTTKTADGIAEFLETKGISAVPGRKYVGAKPTSTFTGLF